MRHLRNIANRRELLIGSAAFAGGTAVGVGALSVHDRVGSFNKGANIDPMREFREGNYAVFRGVVLAASEMTLVYQRLGNSPDSLATGEAVLDLIVR